MNNTESEAKILIVDDESETRDIFKRQLQDDFFIDTADSVANALEKLEKYQYHIVMTDLVMPKEDGISLLKKVKKRWPHIAVMVISGKATIEMAVEAMKLGAEDVIEKPVEDLELLKLMVRKILKHRWQAEELERLKEKLAQNFESANFVGNSYSIQKILEKVRLIASLDTTVLITGETGVGKEMFADLIYKNSKRKTGKFVALNCGGLPESLLESMLFGHKKGSFTGAIKDKIGYFQEANNGTLFLDEIAETTPMFQIKLLRVLEKGVIRQVGGDNDINVNVRIIAATNKDLSKEIESGNFREDLYYRLNVININVPPLRKRVEDIKLLANTFVNEFALKHNKKGITLSQPVLSILTSYEWKGNVRELRNAVEHSVAMAAFNKILPEDLPSNIYMQVEKQKSNRKYDNLPYAKAKEVFERSYIEYLMEKFNGDIAKAVSVSKIKRQNIYEKLKKFNINLGEYRKK